MKKSSIKNEKLDKKFKWDIEIGVEHNVTNDNDPIEIINVEALPEEVILRIFVFADSDVRVRMGRVCELWYRISKDETLRSKLKELEDAYDAFLSAPDNLRLDPAVIIVNLSHPIMINLDRIVNWQNEIKNLLFPANKYILTGENLMTIPSKIGLVRNILKLTEFFIFMDMWKRYINTIYHSYIGAIKKLPQLHIQYKPGEFTDQHDIFLRAYAFIDPFFLSRCPYDGAFSPMKLNNECAHQFTIISKLTIQMIETNRYRNLEELKELLWMLCLSMDVMHFTNATSHIKKQKFKFKKALHLIKHNYSYIPPWLYKELAKNYTKYKIL